MSISRRLILCGTALSCLALIATARSQNQRAAHLGSPVIMVRYETPELSGQRRAAIIVDGPFPCPPGETPYAGAECADIVWWVNERGVDPENVDPTLSDWRKNVLHDPTGETPRSWHVWGEAHDEQ